MMRMAMSLIFIKLIPYFEILIMNVQSLKATADANLLTTLSFYLVSEGCVAT